MDRARGYGDEMVNHRLNDAQIFFRQFVLDSCGEMPGCSTGLAVFLKRATWAETLPDPTLADEQRPVHPAPTPIPGWQAETATL